jgi:amino acid adenylation domain-containing protein
MVIFGGDKLEPAYLKSWTEMYPLNGIHLVNMYGITETTIHVTHYTLRDEDITTPAALSPIGVPLPETTVYIFNSHLQLQPALVTGELYVGGSGVSRGYLNNSKLTHGRFLENPYKTGEILYQTGDLGRWLSDGSIQYVGRIDHQVQIRGFRIEMGEIESQLLTHEHIKEAVVTDREKGGDKYLCAYIVPHTSSSPTAAELRRYLSNTLPDYMIPSFFIVTDKIPLTSNGKVDRKSLPEPEVVSTDGEYTSPRDAVEERLEKIWSEVLDIRRDALHVSHKIGIDANFFELGGHSLKAAALVSRIHKAFNVKMPFAELFVTPTIRGLAAYIKKGQGQGQKTTDLYTLINAVEKKECYPLSSAQKRLYILYQMDIKSLGYNMPTLMTLDGELQIEKLEETFEKLIARHESLRMSFHMVNEKPVQKIHKEVDFKIEYDKGSNSLTSYLLPLTSQFIRPFDLSQAPLLRVGILKTGEERHILMVDMHHIISDGISIGIFVREFMALYKGDTLPELRLQYKDYSEWQNSEKEKEVIKKQQQYWLKHFKGEIPVVDLPTDYVRPVVQEFEGNTVNFEIAHKDTNAIKEYALKEECTLYMVLLAIFNIFLSKISSQEEIAVGTPTAGRRHTDLDEIIGIFVNTLALKIHVNGQKTFKDFLRKVKERTLEAFDNQDYQYEDLVEQASVTRDTSRNPLFDIMFILQNIDFPEVEIPGLKLKPYQYENKTSKFDLTLTVKEMEEKLSCGLEYSTKLFKEETIQRFIHYFMTVTSRLLERTDVKISGIEIITDEEKKEILVEFNNTDTLYPCDRTLHQLFEEQVDRSGDTIAAIGREPGAWGMEGIGPLEKRHAPCTMCHTITYNELNEKSNQLVHQLKEKGVKPNTLVGVMVSRSIKMLIGLLGILKVGSSYLPVDPGFPQGRIEYLLQKSSPDILLTQSHLQEKLEPIDPDCEILDLLDIDKKTHIGSRANPGHRTSPMDLAYVIYTSGSTGSPKGIMIQHRNVVNFIHGMAAHIDFSPGKCILAVTTISFDIFVLETLLPLTRGMKIVIAHEELQTDPGLLAEAITRHQIDILQFTPSRLKLLFTGVETLSWLKQVKELLVGGETFPTHLLKELKQVYHGKLYNVYGPTETTVWSTIKELTSSEFVTIGIPIANTQIYIVDNHPRLQPIGIPGELLIGGDGVAKGYFRNPSLTGERFIDNPFRRGDRVYRTGDVARWLPNGEIEYLGRKDFQVKIRGFRIELEEIEDHLSMHEDIKEAVVLAREHTNGNTYLCAYIVPIVSPSPQTADSTNSDIAKAAQWRTHLSRVLPEYMIPSFFVQLERIPFTPNGKIDRKALPEPDITAGIKVVKPRNTIEKKLLETWSDVLAISPESISMEANFFELGGHSLRAVTVVSHIQKTFFVKMSLSEFFKFPTIEGLTRYIERTNAQDRDSGIKPMEEKEYHALSSAQRRLYILHQMDIESLGYNMPTLMEMEGNLNKEKLEETFEKLIARHESLRTSFHMVNEKPVQKIHKEVDFKIEYDKCSNSLTSYLLPLTSQFIRPFDLSQAPLLRVGLIQLEEKKHILMVDMHHIISDAVSNQILVKDFQSLYRGDRLKPLKLHYRDYSEWQNSEKERERIKQQENYWIKQFSRSIPAFDLPTDYPRTVNRSFEGSTYTFRIDKESCQALRELAVKEGATLQIVMLTILNILLFKISGQEDIVVGTAAAGRVHPDLEKIIGVFINTLALRNSPTGEKTFHQFLNEVKENSLNAYQNQDYPFENLVKHVWVNRNPNRNPLFDVMFEIRDNDAETLELPEGKRPELMIKPFQLENSLTQFDLDWLGITTGEDISFFVSYCTKLFQKETIELMAEEFLALIEDITDNDHFYCKSKELKCSSSVEKELETMQTIEFDF